MALMMALSLPGASKLAPYIHSIAGVHTSASPGAPVGDPPGSTRRKSTVKAAPRASVAPRPSTFKFLQTFPDEFIVGQDSETNLLLQLDRSLEQRSAHQLGTMPANSTPERGFVRPQAPPHSAATQHANNSSPKYPTHPPKPSATVLPEAVAPSRTADQGSPGQHATTQDFRALVAGLEELASPGAEDLVLSQTSTGYIERASTSIAEVEIRQIMSELGPDSLQESPVYRALAGAFGRLQQSEHEAFLHMRTVRFCQLFLLLQSNSKKDIIKSRRPCPF